MAMDVVDYEIKGSEMQFVEVELDPGEAAVGEAGSLMFMDAGIQMDTVFGDGSQQSASGGFMDKLLGAGKRIITGESLFTTVFTHSGNAGKAKVAFAAPYPGTIIPFTLSNYGGKIICQKDSFLAAARGVSIGIFFQKKVMTALFGGEGFIMQKLEGDGLVFVHAGGTIVERELAAGELDAYIAQDAAVIVGSQRAAGSVETGAGLRLDAGGLRTLAGIGGVVERRRDAVDAREECCDVRKKSSLGAGSVREVFGVGGEVEDASHDAGPAHRVCNPPRQQGAAAGCTAGAENNKGGLAAKEIAGRHHAK